MNVLVFLWLLVSFLTVKAGVYSCSSPNSKPSISTESIKTELSVTSMIPFITSNDLNRENLELKKPFLIYYAIDTEEKFMQYSVRFEIAKLQQSCKSDPNVQFIAFLNSMYIKKNSFILCKNSNLRSINFNEFSSLNNSLAKKLKYMSITKHQNRSKLIRYSLDLSKNSNAFSNYPLSHPDFLYELINFTITEKTLFPNSKYAAYINLKSHGSKDHVLAGMHPCQIKSKILNSNNLIKRILSRSEINFLDRMDTPEKVEKDLNIYGKIISKLQLGDMRGLGSFEQESKLGGNRLGGNRLSNFGSGLGDMYIGLGIGQGLGSEFSFGTNHTHLGMILNDLFKEGSDRTLGFLMLESCESNRNPSIYHKDLGNIFGYYSSKKSLWYRNLNWWEILKNSEGLTLNMYHLLEAETSKIPNIEVISN